MIARHIRRSLALRLSAAFLSLSVGTVLLATFVSYRQAETALRVRLLEQLSSMSEEDAAQLAAWRYRQRATIEQIARIPTVRSSLLTPTGGASGGRLISLTDPALLAATEMVLLTVPGGRVFRASDPSRLDTYAVDQLYYREGQHRSFTQSIYPSGETGRPTMTVATPVFSPDSSVRAVLAAHLDLAQMERVLDKRSHGLAIDAYVVNRFAEFVAADRFGTAEHLRGVHSLAIDSALAGGSGAGLYDDYRGRPVVGAWRWLPDLELALVLEVSQEVAFAPARELLVDALLIGLLAAALLTLGVIAIARRAVRPVVAVTAAAETVARGDFTATAPVEGVDEVGRLAAAFNEMTRRLQANRALLQDVVDNATTIVVVVDLERRVLLANRRFEQATGRPAAALIGAPLMTALPSATLGPMEEALDEALERGTHAECEVSMGESGDPHTWQAVAFPLRDTSGAPHALGVVATDLTERARAEEERRQRDARVQQAQKLESLGIMAGGIAHDFNNILGAVLGNVDLARDALADDPEEVRVALDQIGSATRRAAELTRQMLAYAGRASLRSEATDLRPVLHDMVALVRASQSKKVLIELAAMPEPLWVGIDPAQLSQIALNLLTNAAEAVGDIEGLVTIGADRAAPPPGVAPEGGVAPASGWVHLRVTDDGAGIPEDVRRRIFDPFFSTKASGRGLGLSAVNGIIRSSGGALEVVSRAGGPTAFDVYFPSVAAPTGARGAVPAARRILRSGTVLVVDDERALRRIVRRTLEAVGFTVLEAADGVEGLERARAAGDDLVLMVLDLTMPRMGGAEVLTRLRETHPTLPVIVASGYDKTDRRADLLQDTHVLFLQKPFDTKALSAAVNALLQ